MQINYCDFCSSPLKENNFYALYISDPTNTKYNDLGDYFNYVKKVQDNVKEICPTCKHIFDKMFELRLSRLSELAEEINSTYNLPPKKNPKERENEKK